MEHVPTKAYWHNGFLHAAQVHYTSRQVIYPGFTAVWGDKIGKSKSYAKGGRNLEVSLTGISAN